MVQVIGIGFGRTGTDSLRAALDILGYNTFHTKTMFLERPDLLHTWYQNMTQSVSSSDYCPLNLTELLGGYTAATGMMFSVCMEKAIQEYPDAVFILTHRNSPEDWYGSWTTLMDSVSLLPRYAPWLPRVKQMDYYNRWLLSWIHEQDDFFFTSSHPVQQTPALAQASYQKHTENARRLVPPHQLLELPVGSGWDPLAGFLNVSVPPGMEYPHRGTSREVIQQCRLVVITANLLLLTVVSMLPKAVGKLTQKKTPKDKREKEKEEDDVTSEKDKDEDEEEEEEYIPTVKILDRDNDPLPLLSLSQMQQVAAKALPPIVALRCWKRIYRLSRDGDDFGTFLRTTQGYAQTLIVVQTTKKQLIGAFADSPWDASERENYSIHVGGSGFYGSTQACLFAFSDKEEEQEDCHVEVYKWSGLNRYIQLFDASSGRVAFGGGSGGETGFGLCIEDNFSKGTTSACETFNNDGPLTEGDENFAILDVEIWAFPRGTLG